MKPKPTPQLVPPSTIDPADVDYHTTVIRQLDQAQTIVRSWSAYLSSKYQLTAEDQITADGKIIRKPQLVAKAGE
jgi:hypothetical protein